MDENLPQFGKVRGHATPSLSESLLSMQANHQQGSHSDLLAHPQQAPDLMFCFGVGSMQQFDQPLILLDCDKVEKLNSIVGNGPSVIHLNGCNKLIDVGTETKEPQWQRIKWTNEMVKLLITAVSYVVEDAFSDVPRGEREGRIFFPIKGKWRAISKCMVERGYVISPQQCEDKFNDLNKKYKRLNELLGKQNPCDVIEDPTIVESMDIPDETKEEIRKILMCRQLFYHEMFSYHNMSRKDLPHDAALKLSLQSAIRGKIKCMSPRVIEEMHPKKQKRGDHEVVIPPCFPTEPHNLTTVLSEAVGGQQNHDQWIISHLVQLEERKLQIGNEMMQLEMKKCVLLKSNQQEDRDLCVLKLENELLKLENERLTIELKIRDVRAYRT